MAFLSFFCTFFRTFHNSIVYRYLSFKKNARDGEILPIGTFPRNENGPPRTPKNLPRHSLRQTAPALGIAAASFLRSPKGQRLLSLKKQLPNGGDHKKTRNTAQKDIAESTTPTTRRGNALIIDTFLNIILERIRLTLYITYYIVWICLYYYLCSLFLI